LPAPADAAVERRMRLMSRSLSSVSMVSHPSVLSDLHSRPVKPISSESLDLFFQQDALSRHATCLYWKTRRNAQLQSGGRRSEGMRPDDVFIERTLELVERMISIADEGDRTRQDRGCGVLCGVLRDSAFKIRRLAEEERELHARQGPSGPDQPLRGARVPSARTAGARDSGRGKSGGKPAGTASR